MINVEIPPIDVSAEEIKTEDKDAVESKKTSPKQVQAQVGRVLRSRQILPIVPARSSVSVSAQQRKDASPSRPKPVQEETPIARNFEEHDSEATSESDNENEAHGQDSFDVSDESSLICSDMSDIDGGRNDDDCVEIKDEHPLRDRTILLD